MKVEAWLVVKGTSGTYSGTHASGPYKGQKKIDKMRATRLTAGKPTLAEDEITFKIEMDVDESWFLDGTATIVAQVPAAPQSTATIQAQVDMPIKGRAQSAAAAVIRGTHP